jgi:hypothetical protein
MDRSRWSCVYLFSYQEAGADVGKHMKNSELRDSPGIEYLMHGNPIYKNLSEAI